MALQRGPRDDLRLFVAVYPPAAVARGLLGAVGRLEIPEHRLTPVEQVHLTIQFIGDTRVKDLERVRESVERAASGIGPFRLRPMRLITLPERGLARLVAAETDDPAPMMELQRRLAHRLARTARAKAGDRFLPHITLCRFRAQGERVEVDEEIEGSDFLVEHFALMRSVLRAGPGGGALHEEVARIGLTGA